jgi:hypothetical protein
MMKKICLCVLILLFASVCLAQDEKMTPEQQQAMIQQQMNAMTPMFGQMMRVMMTATFDVLSQPESAEKLASFTRNYYDALIKKGFSKDEALKIAMSVGMPSMPMMQK